MKRKLHQVEQQHSTTTKKVKHEFNNNNNNSTLIPDDMVWEIFSFLPYQALVKVALTNKYIYGILFDSNFWTELFQHQTIVIKTEMLSNKEALFSFLTKYQVSNVFVDYNFKGHDKDEFRFIVSLLWTIEPFVRELSFIPHVKSDDNLKKVVNALKVCESKLKFAKLVSLESQLSLTTLTSWLGHDLSRVKQLSLVGMNGVSNLQLGNIVNLNYVDNGNDTLFNEIVLKNKNTLRSVCLTCWGKTSQFIESLPVISESVTNLRIRRKELMSAPIPPIVFNNLRSVTFEWNSWQLLSFFSVPHPSLTHITLKQRVLSNNQRKRDHISSIEYHGTVVNQQNVTHLDYTGPSHNLNKVLCAVASSLKHLTIQLHAGSDAIELPDCRTLESLECSVLQNAEAVRYMLQKYPISKLYTDYIDGSLYLDNIKYLTVQQMGADSFIKVLKLPALKRLHIILWKNSYAVFSNILETNSNQVSSSIGEIVLEDFKRFCKQDELISILPADLTCNLQMRFNRTSVASTDAWLILLASCLSLCSYNLDYSSWNFHISNMFYYRMQKERTGEEVYLTALKKHVSAALEKLNISSGLWSLENLKTNLLQKVAEMRQKMDPLVQTLVKGAT
jgi:hypothetical protein